jgi:hypothetical protein
VALAVVTLAAAQLVVFHPKKDAGTWWLIGATVLLALFTAGLAYATFSSVREAARTAHAAEEDLKQGHDLLRIGQQQVAVAHKALNADLRPVLIPTLVSEPLDAIRTRHWHKAVQSSPLADFPILRTASDGAGRWVLFKIRNVGRGPAMIGGSDRDLLLQTHDGRQIFGDSPTRILAPDDRAILVFREDLDGSAAPASGFEGRSEGFHIRVSYSDISYQRMYRGTFAFDESSPPALLKASVEDLNFEDEAPRS